jgi:hypothetical protein
MTLLNMMNYVQNNKTMGNKTIIDTLQLAYKYRIMYENVKVYRNK